MEHTTSARVGRNVRAELARQGMSQAELGQAVGLTQGQISKRLRGEVAFDVNELAAVAGALHVRVEQLYTEPVAAGETA